MNEKEKQNTNPMIIKLSNDPNLDDTTCPMTVTDDHFISKMENIIINNDTTNDNKRIDKNNEKTVKSNTDANQYIDQEVDNQNCKTIQSHDNSMITEDLSVTKKDKTTKIQTNINWKTMKKEIQQEIDMKLKENKKLKKKGKNKNLEISFLDISGQSDVRSTVSSTTISPNGVDNNSRHNPTNKSNNRIKKENNGNNVKLHSEKDALLLESSVCSSQSLSEQSTTEQETQSDSSISTNTSIDDEINHNQSSDSISYFFYNPNLKVKRVISNPMVRSFINSRNKKNEKDFDNTIKEKEEMKQGKFMYKK